MFKTCLNVLIMTKGFLKTYIVNALPSSLPMENHVSRKFRVVVLDYQHSGASETARPVRIRLGHVAVPKLPNFFVLLRTAL
jgi:hypothetical protein